MIKLNRAQIESLGYEVTEFVDAVLVSPTEPAAPLVLRACPICGTEGGLVLGTLRVHATTGVREIIHRCHIECVDWPTVPCGNRTDPTHDGLPICDECLEAAGRQLDSCPELPDDEQRACWACEAIMREAQADAAQLAVERVMRAEADLLDERQERQDDRQAGALAAVRASRPKGKGNRKPPVDDRQAEIEMLAIQQAMDKESVLRGEALAE